MKVRVTLVIELDEKQWVEYNGCDPTDVGKDVKSHVLNHVQGSAILEESDATVTLA